MVVAQTIIAFPLVAGFTMAAVMGVDPAAAPAGAPAWAPRAGRPTLAVLTEARVGVIVAVIAGFGAIISEVGAVMLVGGNIEDRTRADDGDRARRRARATSTWRSRWA